MRGLIYKQAGVDIKKGDQASFQSFLLARKTYRKEVREISGIPVFSARFAEYKNPCFLGATDGVGTKLKIAFASGIHSTVGIDLVAMSVNDLIRRGAEPLIFLPYLATSKIIPEVAKEIAMGIVEGCQQAGCTILGGETAELPDFYKRGEYDLAATAIGIVDREKIITGEKIKEGDQILALPSSGLHSNGFSLVRKVLLPTFALNDKVPELGGKTLALELLTPTRIYVKSILSLLKKGIEIHGLAHITGGGIISKLGKIIPKNLSAKINKKAWQPQPIFSLIQKTGKVEEEEMFRTFNMGLGIILVVPRELTKKILKKLPQAIYVGEIVRGKYSSLPEKVVIS